MPFFEASSQTGEKLSVFQKRKESPSVVTLTSYNLDSSRDVIIIKWIFEIDT